MNLIDLNKVEKFDDIKKLINIPNSLITTKKGEYILASSDAISFINDNSKKIVAYFSAEDPDIYINVLNNKIIGTIDEVDRAIYEIEPMLFGYPVFLYNKNDIFIYTCVNEDYISYTISNYDIGVDNIG